MASTPVTPSAPAAPATPAAAPASTPSPAVSTPVAPVTTPAAPVTPAEPTPIPRNKGENNFEYNKRIMETRAAERAAVAAGKPPEPANPVEAVAPPVAEAEPVKTEEQKATEAAAAAKAEADKTKPVTEVPSEFDIPEDELEAAPLGVLTPKDLDQKIQSSPELKAALEKSPDVKAQLFKMSRMAAEAAEVLAELPSKDAALFAKEQTQQLNSMRDKLMSSAHSDDPKLRAQGLNEFLGMITAETFLFDEETGKPVEKDGRAVTDGTLEVLCDHIMGTGLENLLAVAKQTENAELEAALQLVMDVATKGSSTSPDELTEAQRVKQVELDRASNDLRAREQRTAKEKRDQVESRVRTTATDELRKQTDKVIARYEGLSDYTKEQVATDLRKAVLKKMDEDPWYKTQRDYLVTLPQTKDTVEKRERLVRSGIRTFLPQVFRPVMEKATSGTLASADARKAKTDAQVAQSKAEPRGGTAAPLPPPEKTGADALIEFRATWKKDHQGHPPPTYEETKFLVGLKTRLPKR